MTNQSDAIVRAHHRSSSDMDVPNAETRAAMGDAAAGNVRRVAGVVALFEALDRDDDAGAP